MKSYQAGNIQRQNHKSGKNHVELQNGIKTVRSVFADAAAVVAVDENNEILLVTQYRYPIGRDMLELPAGLVDEGEEPLDAAKRELMEETGYRADKWKLLASIYASPGVHNEKIHIFSASNLKRVSDQKLDTDELLAFDKIPFDEALQMVNAGKITDAKTIIGILLFSAGK